MRYVVYLYKKKLTIQISRSLMQLSGAELVVVLEACNKCNR